MRWLLASFAVFLAATPALAQTTLERGNHNEAFAIAVSPTSNHWEAGRVPINGNVARAQAQADQGALRGCGAGCTVILRFAEPACMVLARGTPGWGGAYASSPEAARAQALADCSAHNQNCHIQSQAYCYR
jgi:hypothetical protein